MQADTQGGAKAGTKSVAKSDWWIPVSLIILGAVPFIAGIVRLVELASDAPITPANARFFAYPVSAVLHIFCSIIFSIVGAFQFSSTVRRQHPAWHRNAGRLLVVCGLISGISGLWMNQFYPHAEGDSDLLYGFRLLFGSVMIICMVKGFTAIRRRDITQHRAWMMRGYAIGLGAGTQAVDHFFWLLFFDPPGEIARAWLLGGGWAINLLVAEWIIFSKYRTPTQSRNLVI